MKQQVFIFTLLLFLVSKAFAINESLQVSFKDKVITVDDNFQKMLGGPTWKVVKRIDPNSKTMTTYEGYELADFFSFLKKKFSIEVIHHIETLAIDGYKLNIEGSALESKGAFLALKVYDIPKRGLYNKMLKSYFDWRPSYILLDPKSPKVSVASPYQVKAIKIYDESIINPILTRLDETYQAGAKVFIKTCSKCHSLKGFGGKKAPAMNLVIKRWKLKKDDALEAFLRNPQGTLKRKIQMSAFNGSQKELSELIKFLRSL
ncbi:MAG: cytochrome c [Bacteriovoracaceae bacterium]|nr:cytochrome c [Bacteriovoracaceae bacterium]